MSDKADQDDDKKPGDPRVEGIATVGWVTLAALGICIPLSAIIGETAGWLTPILPLSIIFGAGIMAVRIWSSGEKQVNQKENDALRQRIEDLEERLGNLEVVDSLEAHMAERHRPPSEDHDAGSTEPTMGPIREGTTN